MSSPDRRWKLLVSILVGVLAHVTPAAGQVLDLRDIEAGEGPAPVDLPEPEQVLARHIDAAGGRAAHERIRNRRVVGTFVQDGGAPSRLVIHEAAPGLRHVRLERGATPYISVTNREESWTVDGDAIMAAGGDQRVQEIRRAVFHPLLDWEREYELAKTLGIEPVDGRDAYVVRLTAEDCHKVQLFFDVETGLHVRTVEDLAYAGDTIRTDTLFADYRAVDGVSLPMRSRRVLLYRGVRMVQEYEITEVEHGIEIPAGLFDTPPELAPPADVAAGLTPRTGGAITARCVTPDSSPITGAS